MRRLRIKREGARLVMLARELCTAHLAWRRLIPDQTPIVVTVTVAMRQRPGTRRLRVLRAFMREFNASCFRVTVVLIPGLSLHKGRTGGAA